MGYPLARACTAFDDQLARLQALLATFDDDDLHARSRCRGWVVADVLAHLHLGLQEMLCGFPMRTDAAPDTDHASYWRAPLPGSEHPEFEHVRFARALSSAYARPTALLEHMAPTVAALRRITRQLDEPYALQFQGHVLDVGDFVATWVLEVAVHHLDVTVELPGRPAPAGSALEVCRDSVAALLPPPTREATSGRDATALLLAASGREPLDDTARAAFGAAAGSFPLLG
ncbi:maleylpyruvate isomerase N-terminal domain-containing protein [Pseudonocardia sp. KRD291]|uniref:maleylpyruvate isomerase N-terminal domain-containing protein n=1 Tax=Pseudonocardia sp. KRD291 TaxID=2792007 RepID=UPI001C4A08BA|nr:maleylpyruvate isomerase N-terminal domain-containing protein [Pseudonocardia sp. KRD291]MBW0103088.1 maleylpyruvate isomerase N-terminal domain-containing protein [Pseudonocardia sp. KRD291]